MRRLFALLFALGLSGLAAAAQPLLAPADLVVLLDKPNVRVIDIRDPKSYAASHIPGAVSAPYGTWRGPATNPGELPPLPKLAARVQSLGLTPDTHAVVVSSGDDATDFGASARVYWTLKVLGLRELSVLNGGMAAWSEAKLAQDANPVAVAPSTYEPKLDESMIATREQMIAAVNAGSSRLVDARPAAFFRGETRHQAAKLPGTLKGAVNVEHASWFKPGTSTFVSTEEAQRIAAAKPLDPAVDTVSFCNTGHWAATNWFAMSEVLGQRNVKLYAGSMVDWTQDPQALPMDNVPNRAQQLVIDWKLWMDRTFQ
ncbi:MAG TPA: sulfurtransferase [Casimicrobiaceae bacterium]|nr:sulfurtransferase [Casimicrobiaceae bacterium]